MPGSPYRVKPSALEALDGTFRVKLREGDSVIGRAVVIATGVRYRRLPIGPILAKFEGHERPLCRHADLKRSSCRGEPIVAVVAGGNSAGQASAAACRDTYQIEPRRRASTQLEETMSRYLADRIMRACLPSMSSRIARSAS